MAVEMRELGAIKITHPNGKIAFADFTLAPTSIPNTTISGACVAKAYGSYDLRVFENSEYSTIVLLVRAGSGLQPCDFWSETEDDMLIPGDIFKLYNPEPLGTILLSNYTLTIADETILNDQSAGESLPELASVLAERPILDFVLRGGCNAGHNSSFCALRTTHSPYILYGVKNSDFLWGYDAFFLFEERFV